MKTVQAGYTPQQGWQYVNKKQPLNNPLVFVFGSRLLLEDDSVFSQIQQEFPYKDIVYVSTAGEIQDDKVHDESVTVTAIEFEKSTFSIVTGRLEEHGGNPTALAKSLGCSLPVEGLKHLMAFASGSFLNGSALVQGFSESQCAHVAITGGLSGDGSRFEKTVAGYNTKPEEGLAILIGIYGGNPEITYASFGGFQPLGPARKVTKATDNVVYEIDGKPALELYKAYLGDRVMQKMESLLAFPLQITEEGKDYATVRTVLQIENTDGSVVLAGNCPEGATVQLMMASMHGIAEGATEAANQALANRSTEAEVAIVVSCMGRKAIMGERIEDETELLREAIGPNATITGFYSYAEIAPNAANTICELHNQTMTLTLISE